MALCPDVLRSFRGETTDATRLQRLSREIHERPGFDRYPATWVRTRVAARGRDDQLARVSSYVFFVGYPRSGHSLVGSLLDAHPDMAIAHEMDALRFVRGYSRNQLFHL